jgi:hypothetical protein
MTNNHPNLYAVILEVGEKGTRKLDVSETFENEGIMVWPIKEISEMVNKCDDAYFLSALARITLSGIYTINLSENNRKND